MLKIFTWFSVQESSILFITIILMENLMFIKSASQVLYHKSIVFQNIILFRAKAFRRVQCVCVTDDWFRLNELGALTIPQVIHCFLAGCRTVQRQRCAYNISVEGYSRHSDITHNHTRCYSNCSCVRLMFSCNFVCPSKDVCYVHRHFNVSLPLAFYSRYHYYGSVVN